ncbi:hypothetical protein ACIRPK_34315 [Kitasatospora sp. NPDC101801]|uniref:hypothetical protein n=1 Tax=Kitasatospora sp. NPDC101801 TaxID=3364103 RepID=UPI0038225EF3
MRQSRADGDSTLSSTPVKLRWQFLTICGSKLLAGYLDLDQRDVGPHGLGADAVTAVVAARVGPVVPLVAGVAFDLALQHSLGQLLRKPTPAGRLEPAHAGTVDHLPDQLLVQQVRRQLDWPNLFNRLTRGDHVAHQVLFLDRRIVPVPRQESPLDGVSLAQGREPERSTVRLPAPTADLRRYPRLTVSGASPSVV